MVLNQQVENKQYVNRELDKDLSTQKRLRYLYSLTDTTLLDGRKINRYLAKLCHAKINARNWFLVDDYEDILPEGVCLKINELLKNEIPKGKIWIVDPDFTNRNIDPFLIVTVRANTNQGFWESENVECNEHLLVIQWEKKNKEN